MQTQKQAGCRLQMRGSRGRVSSAVYTSNAQRNSITASLNYRAGRPKKRNWQAHLARLVPQTVPVDNWASELQRPRFATRA